MRDPCKLNDQDSMMSELRNDIWNNKLIEKWAKVGFGEEKERETYTKPCAYYTKSQSLSYKP